MKQTVPVSRRDGEVFGVVDVEDEKSLGVERVDGLDGRAARVEVETVDDQSHVGARHARDDLGGQLKRLHAATRLAQELERQPDAVGFGHARHLKEHAHRLLDHRLPPHALGQQARHDDHVRATDLGGRAAQLLALVEYALVRAGVPEGDVLDGVDAVGRDAGRGERVFQFRGRPAPAMNLRSFAAQFPDSRTGRRARPSMSVNRSARIVVAPLSASFIGRSCQKKKRLAVSY